MPVTLVLLRHAKSSWDDLKQRDRDRPLNARGRAAAPAMGAWLASRGIRPDAVLCSPAVRTRETWDLVRPFLPALAEVRIEEHLYLAEPEDLLAAVRAVAGGVSCLLVVGHNPGLEEFARDLVGEGPVAQRAAMSAKFPTAGCAVIAFPGRGAAAVAPGKGRLVHWMTPKTLPAGSGIKT